jgi:outer membrane protein OmpA-like peptidoglycan-associated protein
VEDVSSPQKINTDAADAGNRAVRAEVLKRIDVTPRLGEAEKDKLYVQVERAQAMGMVIAIPFASGARKVSPAAVAGIAKALALPQVQKFASDPTVVFVVLGYADKKGDRKMNEAISLERAEAVADVLKNKSGVENLIRAVGMGGSDLFGSTALDKNRVVEVWVVLP